jgi:hypothetical protein
MCCMRSGAGQESAVSRPQGRPMESPGQQLMRRGAAASLARSVRTVRRSPANCLSRRPTDGRQAVPPAAVKGRTFWRPSFVARASTSTACTPPSGRPLPQSSASPTGPSGAAWPPGHIAGGKAGRLGRMGSPPRRAGEPRRPGIPRAAEVRSRRAQPRQPAEGRAIERERVGAGRASVARRRLNPGAPGGMGRAPAGSCSVPIRSPTTMRADRPSIPPRYFVPAPWDWWRPRRSRASPDRVAQVTLTCSDPFVSRPPTVPGLCLSPRARGIGVDEPLERPGAGHGRPRFVASLSCRRRCVADAARRHHSLRPGRRRSPFAARRRVQRYARRP